jgi:hypothetical protein
MKHAKFSASRSHRWTNCSASLELEATMPNKDSFFSQEGTFAHDIAYKFVTSTISDNDLLGVSGEMIDCAKAYSSYIDKIVTHDFFGKFFEKTVYFGEMIGVSNDLGFGTADCILYDSLNKELHVIDFKYGKGIKVSVQDNTQLLLYGIGAYKELIENEIVKLHLHIVQPRINHYESTVLDITQLKDYWIPFFTNKAALTQNANSFSPSLSVCKFCKVKPLCPALKGRVDNLQSFIKKSEPINLVEEEQINEILSSSALIVDYLSSVKDYVYSKAQDSGSFAGWTLAKGKTVRKIREDLIPDLEKELGIDLYKKTPLGVIEIEKILRPLHRDIKDFVQQIEQKAILVKENEVNFEFSN